MKSKDMMILEEKYENIFAGRFKEEKEDDDTDKEDEDTDKEEKEEKDEDSEDSEKEEDKEEDDSDEDSDEEHEEEESEEKEDKEEKKLPHKETEEEEHEEEESESEETEEESEESEESEEDEESEEPEVKGSKEVQNKVQALKKQYNDIIRDAFNKYAPECISAALDDSDAAFGENIETVVQGALDNLRDRILSDFGIERPCDTCSSLGTSIVPYEADTEGNIETDKETDVEDDSNEGGNVITFGNMPLV